MEDKTKSHLDSIRIEFITNNRMTPVVTTLRITDLGVRFQPSHTYWINYKKEKEFENIIDAMVYLENWIYETRKKLMEKNENEK